MKRALLAISVLLAGAPAYAQPAAEPAPEAPPKAEPITPADRGSALAHAGITTRMIEVEDTWDLDLEGAYGGVLCKGCGKTGFARARVGFLSIRDRLYFMGGVTYDIGDRSLAVVGLQAEILQLEAGWWVQGGAQLDLQHLGERASGPGFMVAGGWSLFGAELQRRSFDVGDPPHWAIYGKIRLPVRLILRATGLD